MNKIESLDELIAEKKRLKRRASDLESDFKYEVDSIGEKFAPVVSLLNIPKKIFSAPVLGTVLPALIPGKGKVAAVIATLATEMLLTKINPEKILSVFKRKKK